MKRPRKTQDLQPRDLPRTVQALYALANVDMQTSPLFLTKSVLSALRKRRRAASLDRLASFERLREHVETPSGSIETGFRNDLKRSWLSLR